jgi:hypothetical protein
MKPLTLTLLALDEFEPDDLGWVTKAGVVRLELVRKPPDAVFVVTALGFVKKDKHGAFVESEGPPRAKT